MKIKIRCFILFAAFSLNVNAQVENDSIKAIKCAQDIVDFGYGGNGGIKVATQILKDLVSLERGLTEIHEECRAFLRTNTKIKPDRRLQLQTLSALKSDLSDEAYYFLRGVIRPLIACKKSHISLRTCTSTTGKQWIEMTLKQGTKSDVDFRLGHTDGGLLVKGPQDYLNEEDLNYIDSLPSSYTMNALESLRQGLERHYLKAKVFKKASTFKFLRHYFSSSNH